MKKLKQKTVFSKHSSNPILWKDVKDFAFEDEDEINWGYEEPFYTENNSHDGYFYCTVNRMVLETNEQYERRLSNEKLDKERLYEMRKKSFLKLKEEFKDLL